MGANQSFVQAKPQPVQQGFAVFAPPNGSPHTYVAKQALQLHVKESAFSMSGDSFTVVDKHTGKQWFKVAGKAISLHQRKVLHDVAGVPVWTLRHKGMSMHQTKVLSPGESDSPVIVEARQEVTLMQAYKEVRIRATAQDLISGRSVNITLMGDMRGKSGVILLGDERSNHVIAKMYKPTGAHEIFSGQQEYDVDVAAGVDTALISAMCVIWDEAAHDGNGGGGILF